MSTTQSSNGLTVTIPDLPGALRQIALVLDPKKAKKIYRKAISAGGRVLLAAAKKLVPNSRVKRPKKQARGRYGRSGALKKALKMFYRTGKSGISPYAVIGADRDAVDSTTRGNQVAKEIPSNTIHLVEDGFTAVSRVSLDGTKAGRVKGSKLKNSVLGLLRTQRPLGIKAGDINMKNALEQRFDQKLFDSRSLGWLLTKHKTDRQSVEAYIKGYKAATKTKVRPRKFMEQAQKTAGPAARKKAVEILLAEYDKLVSIYRVK